MAPTLNSPNHSASNPYQAPSADVYYGNSQGSSHENARRFTRWAAATLDNLIYMAGFFIIAILAGGVDESSDIVYVLIALSFMVVLGINLYFMHQNGQTIGKKMLGIKVVRTSGEPAGFARLVFLRALPFCVISVIPLIPLINALMIFGEKRRCGHDHIADTIVVIA